jgi:heat shock protein HtpX
MFFTMVLLGGLMLAIVWIMLALDVPIAFVVLVAGGFLVFQYFMSDKLVLWSTGAHVVSPEEAPGLHRVVARIAQAADLPMPKVAIIEADVPNAFATGRNPKNSVVAVTTGILRRLEPSELEAVLAHEISHVKHRDILVMTMANFVAVVAAFLMRMFMWSSLLGGGRDRRDNGAALAVIGFIVSIVVMVIAQLLVLALSRYREYAADRGGAIITGHPSHLASALQKITGDVANIPTRDLRDLQPANALLFAGLKGSDISGLFSTHPPVGKRIEKLRQMQIEMERPAG